MTEENKQEEQPKETVPEQTAEEEKPKGPPPKPEIPKNCGACKKPIQKVRYYRNMLFFCNKKCWSKFKAAEEKKKQEEAAKTQEPSA